MPFFKRSHDEKRRRKYKSAMMEYKRRKHLYIVEVVEAFFDVKRFFMMGS